MTKEELRDYQAIKAEIKELNALLVKLARCDKDEELRSLYRQKAQTLTDRIRAMEEAIDALGPTERRLMRLRYIEGLSWQAISMRIHYSWQQTHRIHKNALIKLKEK